MDLIKMSAKELLKLQVSQLELMIEEINLKRILLKVELNLGLNNPIYTQRQQVMCENKLVIFRNMLSDYNLSLGVIAQSEQRAVELEFKAKKLEEEIDSNNSALLGTDTPGNDETEIVNDVIVSDSKDNELKKFDDNKSKDELG